MGSYMEKTLEKSEVKTLDSNFVSLLIMQSLRCDSGRKKNIIKDFKIPPPEFASTETWSSDMYPLHLYKHRNYLQLNVKKNLKRTKVMFFICIRA